MSRCPTWLSPATVFLVAFLLQVQYGAFVEGQAYSTGKCPSSNHAGTPGRMCASDANCSNPMKCCFHRESGVNRCQYPEQASCPPLSYYYGLVKPCSSSADCPNANQLCCPHHTGQTVCKYGI